MSAPLSSFSESVAYLKRNAFILASLMAVVFCAALFFTGQLSVLQRYLGEHDRYMSIVGIGVILAIAFACSRSRSMINPRLVISGLAMQFLVAFFILRTHVGQALFSSIAQGFTTVYGFATHGVQFVFGALGMSDGPWGMVFAFQILPIIVFFGALTSLLYHLRIIQVCVKLFSLAIRPLLGTSGAETLCAVANSMLGQTEAPLLIKHYLPTMTHSEILVVMVSGFATLSGALLAIYGSLGVPIAHLLSASVMAIPGSLLMAKMLLPETEQTQTGGGKRIAMKPETKNILDAISTGTVDGLSLAMNVAAMLVTFISLIALVNYALTNIIGTYSLSQFFGFIFAPFARLLGVAPHDAAKAGELLGTKLVINEFVAYSQMTAAGLSPRTMAILTYALCGFANFSCIGIQIGGIGALAPDKREMLTKLGMLALLGGTLTNFLNAAIASLLI